MVEEPIKTHMHQPMDELHERPQDGGIVDLLDDQHRQRWLVPRQPLRRRVLDLPGNVRCLIRSEKDRLTAILLGDEKSSGTSKNLRKYEEGS